jgi:OPA family glycerol-3-phosphate transporter-like MFS transporter/OPA family sugar phosphate sensor protein UhpC-like MFS transporter
MSRLAAALKAQPDTPTRVRDPAEVDRLYRYWRFRILATSIVGYALFYFVRTNIGTPLKTMGTELGYKREQLGIIMTAGGLAYGVSKLLNGMLGDRSNPRYFMAFGLLCSAVINVFFGMSSTLWMLATLWLMNNWFQGMGFPPCARNMGHWFSPRERGTTFGIWHSSHMIGGALISVLTGYLVVWYGWRSCFYVPAALAAVGAVIILIFLRDTPGSLGLPPVEVYKGEETERDVTEETEASEPYLRVVVDYVFTNPYMWVISVSNLLVYILRDVQMKWGATLLQETKHMTVVHSGWLGSGSEIAGLVSALVGGLIADRVFGGRAGRVCVIAMVLMTGVIYVFWKTPGDRTSMNTALFLVMGFLLYVPQMLIAAMAMNLATKRAAAAAVGLTGFLGYFSSILSGWGIGKMVDLNGWDGAFKLMIGCAAAAAVLMAFTWNVGAHPQLQPEPQGFPVMPPREGEAVAAGETK